MKAIKLSLVALATIFSFGMANAQLGIQVGYGNQNSATTGTITAMGGMTAKNSTVMNGFNIGATYDLSIQGPIGLSYGLTYSYFSGTSKNTEPAALIGLGLLAASEKSVGHRMDLPVRIQAGFPVGGDIKLLAFAGPNFTMSLGQKIGDNSLADDKTIAGDKNKYNAFDIQLGGGVGVKFKTVTLKASYDVGMLNRINEPGLTTKANDLRVGLSYNF